MTSALAHETAARRLVHLLKYQAIAAAGAVLAAYMMERLPVGASALIPVPRAAGRRIRYGVDPADVLAKRLGAMAGIEVIPVLRSGLWWPAHAGRSRAARTAPRFGRMAIAPANSVLVDDVCTTGATIAAAASAAGVETAITATRADSACFG